MRKDGPSAGVATMAVALASLLTGRPVRFRSDVAMTGEITKPTKCAARCCRWAASRTRCWPRIDWAWARWSLCGLPHKNENDLDDLPGEVRESLDFVLAERVDDVLGASLGEVELT